MAGVSADSEADSAPDVPLCVPALEPTISLGGDKPYQHPSVIANWCDDMKKWPQVQMPHIIHYLLTNKACDLREVNSFRSMESYTYLQSGWVGRVLLHEIDEKHVLLKCQVQASQSIKTHHDAWVCCQRSGQVENSGCTCMAGKGKVCSHVGALLWKVDMAVSQGLTGEACTDISATWNRGTKRNLEPGALTDMNFKVQLRTIDNDTTEKAIPILPQLLGDDADVENFYRDCPFKDIVNAPGTLLHATLTAPFRQPQPRATPTIQHGSHDSADSLPHGCVACNDFYVKYVMLSDAAMVALELSTRNQGNSLWHVSRRLRITASNVRRVPKKATTAVLKALQCITNPSFRGNAATQHGLNNETMARLQFEKDFGLVAEQRGIFVCKEKPWLSATPDGIIESHSAILEIKCPFALDCKEVIRREKYDVVEKDGTYMLNKNGPNGYYSQVQFTMLCTRKQRCFFYLWSPKAAIHIDVPFNLNYVTQEMPRLQKFYFCNMLPCLQEMESKGTLDLKEYRKIADM